MNFVDHYVRKAVEVVGVVSQKANEVARGHKEDSRGEILR